MKTAPSAVVSASAFSSCNCRRTESFSIRCRFGLAAASGMSSRSASACKRNDVSDVFRSCVNAMKNERKSRRRRCSRRMATRSATPPATSMPTSTVPSQTSMRATWLTCAALGAFERAELARLAEAEDHPPQRQRDGKHHPRRRGGVLPRGALHRHGASTSRAAATSASAAVVNVGLVMRERDEADLVRRWRQVDAAGNGRVKET